MATRTLTAIAHQYRWFHRWMGIVGNALFVVGSIFFLSPTLLDPGTWIFIIASSGMLIDSIGEKMVKAHVERTVSP